MFKGFYKTLLKKESELKASLEEPEVKIERSLERLRVGLIVNIGSMTAFYLVVWFGIIPLLLNSLEKLGFNSVLIKQKVSVVMIGALIGLFLSFLFFMRRLNQIRREKEEIMDHEAAYAESPEGLRKIKREIESFSRVVWVTQAIIIGGSFFLLAFILTSPMYKLLGNL